MNLRSAAESIHAEAQRAFAARVLMLEEATRSQIAQQRKRLSEAPRHVAAGAIAGGLAVATAPHHAEHATYEWSAHGSAPTTAMTRPASSRRSVASNPFAGFASPTAGRGQLSAGGANGAPPVQHMASPWPEDAPARAVRLNWGLR